MKKLLAAVLIALSFAFPAVGSVDAAPITCPPGQEAAKTADWWDCQNNGGNLSNADETKNPND